jgi:signal transduction histidine kinase
MTVAAPSPVTVTRTPAAVAWLRPLTEMVARIPASVHAKLRAGFLFSALLLVVMAVASLAVQRHIASGVTELNLAQERLDVLRQMDYLVTAQSHYRTMSLLTRDDSYVDSIAQAKADFSRLLAGIEPITPQSMRGVLARIVEADQRFAISGQQVLELYRAGNVDDALRLHLAQEHPISHEIEQPMGLLLNQAEQEMESSRAAVDSDQRLLTGLFIGFSVVSLVTALLLGYVLSWSFLGPLWLVRGSLARIAAGRFDQHLALSNRDEFGELARNLNATSQELGSMYGQLETLNAQLHEVNVDLVRQLQAQVVELNRSRAQIAEAEERLRREIAEVLHSRVQNRLLMVWYRLDDVQLLLDSDPAAAHRLVAEIREQVDAIREQDVRELSHRLHPSIIRAGLLVALDALADETPRLSVTVHADERVHELDDPAQNALPEVVRLTAYRVAEEALGNALKHANATRVDITLTTSDDGLQLEIVDNGRGFDPRQVQPGLGIGSMAARVGRVGGSWQLRSAPGAGTRVSVLLPYSVQQVQDRFSAEVAFGQEGGAELRGDGAVAWTV